MKSLKVMGLMIGLLFIAGAVLPLAARAADVKIGYVDLGKLFDEYEKTKAYDKILEADNTKFQDERTKKIDKIKDLQSKAAMVKDAEKAKVEKDMETLKNEILEFDRTKRTDLTKARDEKVREILLEIEKTVSEYAKKEGYTYVLNDRVLIYGVDSSNITAPIQKILSDNYAKDNKK
ncbi:MAG: OmpH family outer membrane protein [Candidatus Omnitrophica bacterium]|nr:OmpH family outer membrane protein [Candidatus Omnitrophota bacterium]